MGSPNYATREVVKAALENRGGSSSDQQIDRLIASTSRQIERRMHRQFWPWTGTKRFDWPARDGSPSWLLELGRDELVELATISAGEDGPIDIADVNLEPGNYGPPFSWIELNRGTEVSFTNGNTPQRAIAVTGVFGWDLSETSVTGLQTPVDDAAAVLDVADSGQIGHGSLLRLDDERVIVSRMGMSDTGRVTTADMTDRANDRVVYVDSQTLAPEPGEVITVDVERMLVTDRMGLAVAVIRGYDGTATAPHTTGAAVYARRALTVERGAAGTTAVAHLAGADVWHWNPFAPIQTLCVEETIAAVMQENAGMARVVGTAEGQRETSNRGLDDARKNTDRYIRRNRNRAV